jgi:hypothetical protein
VSDLVTSEIFKLVTERLAHHINELRKRLDIIETKLESEERVETRRKE